MLPYHPVGEPDAEAGALLDSPILGTVHALWTQRDEDRRQMPGKVQVSHTTALNQRWQCPDLVTDFLLMLLKKLSGFLRRLERVANGSQSDQVQGLLPEMRSLRL